MLQCFLILDNEERIWAKLQGFDSPRHQFHAGSSGLLHSPPDIVDIKPANMEELTEVITAAEFHPHHCNTLPSATATPSVSVGTAGREGLLLSTGLPSLPDTCRVLQQGAA